MTLIFLLPLLLAAVVSLIWVLVMRLAHGIEPRVRSRSHDPEPVSGMVPRTERAPKPLTIIRVVDAFEPETSMLWDTQMPGLVFIYAAGRCGLATEGLRSLYADSVQRYPELYEGTEFEDWLQFLEDAQLITLREQRVAITTSGVEFLKCRVAGSAVSPMR